LAVSEALFRVGHDAGCDCDDLRARRAREVDTAMERLAARERIGAVAEVRRNPTLRHRAPAWDDLPAQVTRRDQALEHAQLTFAVFDLAGEIVEHRGEIG